LNNLASDRHLHYLTEALEINVGMPCLGGIARDEKISIPERHLGLVTDEDHPLTDSAMEALTEIIEKGINLDSLLESLPEFDTVDEPSAIDTDQITTIVRIGVARDNAFCFYYQDNLDLLEAVGAELVFFSPISDKRLPADLDGLYLGGGYPELVADRLAANTRLRKRIRASSQEGMPIYAECGGFMYLCAELWSQQGIRYPMTGCFPFSAQMFSRLKALGYREITLTKDTIIGPSGQTIRGHEFHYSELNKSESNILGSYTHLHFGSQPQVAEHFVTACAAYRDERK
jgi:cobyrinic acid a,c-diamide synthase